MAIVASDTDGATSAAVSESGCVADYDIAIAIDVVLYEGCACTDAIGVVHNVALRLTLTSKTNSVHKWHRNAEKQSKNLSFGCHVGLEGSSVIAVLQ